MATRTVNAGAGNFNATGTWVEGIVPTAADDVVTNGSSTGTLTINVASACRSFTIANSVAVTHTSTLAIGDASGGALNYTGAGTISGTGTISFISTSNNGGTGWGVTTAAKTMPFLNFNGTGGKWVLQDALTMASTSTLTFTRGTLDTNSKNVLCGLLDMNNGNTRTLTLGSTAWSLNGGGQGGHPILISATGLTMTANTAVFTLSAQQADINNQTAWDLNGGSLKFTGLMDGQNGGMLGLSGTVTCKDLTVIGTAATGNIFNFAIDVVVTGTLTFTGNSRTNQMAIMPHTFNVPRTITCNGTVAITNCDFQDIVGAGSASWNLSAQNDVGDFGGNSGITFPSTITCYWKGTGTGNANWTDANWYTTSGGSTPARRPLCQDIARFDANSVTTTGIISVSPYRVCKDIDCTSASFTSGTFQNTSGFLYIFGSLTLKSGMSALAGGSSSFFLAGRGSHTITSAGVTLGNASNWILTQDGPGGTYTLQDAMSLVGPYTLTTGSLNTNGRNVTCANTFTISSTATTFTTGSSTFSFTSTSATTLLSVNATPTVSAASSTIALTAASTNQRIFSMGGKTYGTLTYTVANSPGQLWIGASTWTTINIASARAFQINNSSTVNVTNWNVNGTPFGYWRAPGATFNQVTTPNSVSLAITDDIDVRIRLALDNWSTSSQALVSKWHVGSGNQGWMLRTSSSSRFEFLINNGTTTSATHSFTNGQVNWIRFARRKSDGRIQWFTAPGTVLNPQTSDWTQLGTDATNSVAFITVTDQFAIGIRSEVDNDPATGNFYRVQIRNNVLDDGTGIVLDADFTANRSAGSGAYTDAAWTTFTESSSNAATMTIGGAVGLQGDGRVILNSSSAGTATTLASSAGFTSTYVTVKDFTATPSNACYVLDGKSVSGNTGIWFFPPNRIPLENKIKQNDRNAIIRTAVF